MTITIELTVEQIVDAIRRLQPDERSMFFRLLALEPPSESTLLRTVPRFTEREADVKALRADLDQELAAAAEALLPNYLNDKELTAFTALDAEDFYAEG